MPVFLQRLGRTLADSLCVSGFPAASAGVFVQHLRASLRLLPGILQDFLRLPPGFKQHLIRLNLCVLQRCRAGGRLLSAALLRLLHRRQRFLCLRSLQFLGLQLFRIWKQICLSLRVGRTLPYIKQ